MPHAATLKGAYRDRPTKRGEDLEDDGESPDFKVPQSFTFMRREGKGIQSCV